MAQGKQFDIITIQTSTHLGNEIAGHFDQYADATGINYFMRISPYDPTLSMLCLAEYNNGVLNTNNAGVIRKRANGELVDCYATEVYAVDVKAGDKYIKIVLE